MHKYKVGDVLRSSETQTTIKRQIVSVEEQGYLWKYPQWGDTCPNGSENVFHSANSTDPFFEMGWRLETSTWTKLPDNLEDLPWPIKAGKRMLWSITIEPHGEYPEAKFVIVGSFMQLSACYYDRQFCVIEDKENSGSGYYLSVVQGYMDCPEPM